MASLCPTCGQAWVSRRAEPEPELTEGAPFKARVIIGRYGGGEWHVHLTQPVYHRVDGPDRGLKVATWNVDIYTRPPSGAGFGTWLGSFGWVVADQTVRVEKGRAAPALPADVVAEIQMRLREEVANAV